MENSINFSITESSPSLHCGNSRCSIFEVHWIYQYFAELLQFGAVLTEVSKVDHALHIY